MAGFYRKAEGLMASAEAMAHGSKETGAERQTRKQHGFHDFESDLPDIKKIPAKDDRPSIGSDVMSYLGSWNPIAMNITDNDTVWLLDNTAFRNSKSNKWQAEFVAAVFDQDTGIEVTSIVAIIAQKLGLAKGDLAEATIRERLLLFMSSILPGRRVEVSFEQKEDLTLGPGGRNAISSDLKTLFEHNDGDIVTSTATVPKGANGVLSMKTVFAEPNGWAVISGLFDTYILLIKSNRSAQTSMIPLKLLKLQVQLVY